jgi:hypothetical protein
VDVDGAVGFGVIVDRVVGSGDGVVGLDRPDVVVDVQPAAAVTATSAPARTSTGGFTTTL